MDEKTAWDIYFAGVVAMQYHPGYTVEKKLSLLECAEVANSMVEQRKKSCLGHT